MGKKAKRAAAAEVESRSSPLLSLSNPAVAEYFGFTPQTTAGVPVSAESSLGLSSVYRAVSLISGTIATLPLKSYRTHPDDTRERVATFLDNPGGPDGLTQFEWTETVLVHLLLWGNAYLLHLYGGAGQLVGLIPLHPSAVTVKKVTNKEEAERYFPYSKYFTLRMADGTQEDVTPLDLTHIPAMSHDGLLGLSPILANRQAIGTGLAGDKAAARMFANGMMLAGLVTSEEDVDADEAKEIKRGLDAKVAGADKVGSLAFVNRTLKFTPWTMPAKDAQFIESRVHQVEEVARIFGVPPHLLGQTEKQTSWGTGVTEQNRGLSRYTLMSWTSRIEQRLSRLLSRPMTCEYDYAGLLQGSPQEELAMLIDQVAAGILTVDEARRIRNLAPLGAATEETADGSQEAVTP
ncbi:MAG TPA: phage portal protein [Acidimicrobiia bacterium]|nr:phage portal protein [Acidimicrobiia bacterium]